jgi:hypothetical protein
MKHAVGAFCSAKYVHASFGSLVSPFPRPTCLLWAIKCRSVSSGLEKSTPLITGTNHLPPFTFVRSGDACLSLYVLGERRVFLVPLYVFSCLRHAGSTLAQYLITLDKRLISQITQAAQVCVHALSPGEFITRKLPAHPAYRSVRSD